MPVLVPFAKRYLEQSRTYHYQGIELEIPNGVFHPGLFFSTKFLIRYLAHKDLRQQSLLELGTGSGLIAMYCAQKGAQVTATDINPLALTQLEKNAQRNQVALHIHYSDLFENIDQSFDWVIINPPYYPRNPKNDEEKAWFCGENFEYFHRLAAQLAHHIHANSKVLMVLSEDCAIEKIQEILQNQQINMRLLEKKEFWLEENYIFSLEVIA